MSSKFLIDTNLLVYQYDNSETAKQRQAASVISILTIAGVAAISTQIMSEFFSISTRKLTVPLSKESAYERLQSFRQGFRVLDITSPIIIEAARGVVAYQFSIWDGMIWATAKLNQIPLILSEDFNTGAQIEGVQFLNPLIESFDLNLWLESL